MDDGATDSGAIDAAIDDAPQVQPVGDPAEMDGDRSEAQTGEYSSAYTSFDLDSCTKTSSSLEADGDDYRCPGRNGVPLFVQDGDARMDIDAGAKNAVFETTGPYNSIGDTVEWRMKDGKPFAVIFRYSVHNEIGRKPTELAIEKIGSPRAPGCRVGQVAGKTPNANRRAREIADSMAMGFRCGTQKPTTVGGTLTSLGG